MRLDTSVRLLEGEPLLYNGIIWIVKGYQHPPGKIIAFPRYDLVNMKRIDLSNRYKYKLYYWDCLKLETPMIDLDQAMLYQPSISNIHGIIASIVSELLGVKDYVITGSTLIGNGNDIDLVIYGFSDEYRSRLSKLIENKVFKRSRYALFTEYFRKHQNDTSLYTYLYIKKNTLLHFMFQGFHVNLKFVKYGKGVNKCVDPVYKREFFMGEIEVVKPIEDLVVPSKYRVVYSGRELFLESYREIYAELPRGKYYVEGFLEYRSDGLYIVPDHGYLLKKD